MDYTGFNRLYDDIRDIIDSARADTYRNINFNMVLAYWNIGKVIVEDEQEGKERADYGKKLIEKLSLKLTEDLGKGFSRQNLQNMKQFYKCFKNCQTLSGKLSWSHYILLMRIDNEDTRDFYLKEAEDEMWSVREMDRQINSFLFERIALSRNKAQVKTLANEGHIIKSPKDVIKDPYILEFLELPEHPTYNEKDLENAIIDKLKTFLLELGKGFAFIDRQKRITLDNEHYYIDLVFYNYILKCFVLIDLKLGKLKHKDIGQMDFYVRYFEKENRKDNDNPTIGIILCSDKNDAMVKYTLLEESRNIFASRYRLCLPTEKDLENEIKREREAIEQEKRLKKKNIDHLKW